MTESENSISVEEKKQGEYELNEFQEILTD